MTEQRMGEIAIQLIISRMAKQGIGGNEELDREIPNVAKKIGVTPDELKEFFMALVPRALNRILGSDKVTIKKGDSTFEATMTRS